MNMAIPRPGLIESKVNGNEAQLTFGPYAPGFATTMGTCIRRCLLSSIPAPGVTSILIEGVNQKFAVVPGMKEELISFIENLKKVNFKFLAPWVDRTSVQLEVSESTVITSKMIKCNQEIVAVLDDVYLCTFHPSDLKRTFKCEIFLHEGTGYVDGSPAKQDEIIPGAIYINNSLNAVKRVALDVEQVRYGDRTDYEILKMQMKVIGITAQEALDRAAKIIHEHLNVFLQKPLDLASIDQAATNPHIGKSVKELGLSEKTVLALQQFGVQTLLDLSRCTETYLLSIPRLGTRKIEDIKEALATFDFALKDVSIFKTKEDM